MIGTYNKLIFDGVSSYVFVKEIKEDVIVLYIDSKKEFLSWKPSDDGQLIDVHKDENKIFQIPISLLSVEQPVTEADLKSFKNKLINEVYSIIQNEISSGKDIKNFESIIKKLTELYNE